MNGRSKKYQFLALTLLLSSAVSASSFTGPSPEALKRATSQMDALDKAMVDGVKVLKAGDLKSIGAHSGHFISLVNSGKALFGPSVLDPLGRCSSAGIYAQSWWAAQVTAAQKGGVESISGSIQDTLERFKGDRAECLKSADPIVSAKIEAESDAELQTRFGGGRECLKSYKIDPVTKKTIEIPRAAHCKNGPT
ncbi:hypothetical protein [Pseudomonas sp. WS 5079]|uniref:hypothetical protein n=1 Tax=Pseudomonas sp. WS 5079 TaxID=2717492 RepID=UPI001556A6E1|nr:hypothetical protein [Pseudomonas sp. WS 5079]NMX60216.1 hypothetical protein [Pseudomonas sp. WS 5079]